MDDLKDEIARQTKEIGAVELDNHTIDALFPHPPKIGLAEMEAMISAALDQRIKLPPEKPTQKEQIQEWCEANEFEWHQRPDRPVMAFRYLGKHIPPAVAATLKASPQDCAIGEAVSPEMFPVEQRTKDIVYTLERKRRAPSVHEAGEAMAAEVIRTIVFYRERLGNGACIFRRVA